MFVSPYRFYATENVGSVHSRLDGWSYLIYFLIGKLSYIPSSEPSRTVHFPDVMYTTDPHHRSKSYSPPCAAPFNLFLHGGAPSYRNGGARFYLIFLNYFFTPFCHKDLTLHSSAKLSKSGVFLKIELKKAELPDPPPPYTTSWGVGSLNPMPHIIAYFTTV